MNNISRNRQCFLVKLNVFIAVLMIFTAGVIGMENDAINDVCEKHETSSSFCSTEESSPKFPETEEELKSVCEFGLEYYKCIADYGEKCNRSKDYVDDAKRRLNVGLEICDQDTPLHEAVVSHLYCYSDFHKKFLWDCFHPEGNFSFSEKLYQYVENTVKESLQEFSGEEFETIVKYCISTMKENVCFSMEVEKKCGTSAMNTIIEIAQKLRQDYECYGMYDFLPEVVRRHKLETEHEKENAVASKRRK